MCIPNVQLQRSRGARGTPGRAWGLVCSSHTSRDRHAYRVYTLNQYHSMYMCIHS